MAVSEDRRTDGSHQSRVIRGVAILMVVEASSLAIASTLHLAGSVHGRSSTFDPDAAGIAEAIIGLVLAVAAVALLRVGVARTAGIAAERSPCSAS